MAVGMDLLNFRSKDVKVVFHGTAQVSTPGAQAFTESQKMSAGHRVSTHGVDTWCSGLLPEPGSGRCRHLLG